MNRLPAGFLTSPLLAGAVFACFLTANSLLSFYPLSLEASGWIGVVGLLLPAVIYLRTVGRPKAYSFSPTRDEFLPKLSAAFFVLLGSAAVFLRFTQLTTLSYWPLEDEAMNGHYAIELAEKGYWQLTYDFSGMPPLYVWCLGSFFKLFGISLTTLWFFPALLSALAVGLGFAGARIFFSRSFSFLFAGLWAVSFWPLYAGRFSVQGGFLIFWMSLTFYCLGRFWKAQGVKAKQRAGFLLGVCAGAGFYTFTSWAIVSFLLTIFIFYTAFKTPRWKMADFFIFFIPQVLLFLILAWGTLGERSGHFRYVLQNPFGGGWPGFNDVCVLFWGSRLPPNLFAYRPFGGGFLNPLFGALCFWGSLVLAGRDFSLWKQAVLFFLLILPGFLTGGLDGHRIIQAMPFLTFVAAIGSASLLALCPPGRRLLLAGILLGLSGGWDAHRLFGTYHDHWTHPDGNVAVYKPVERGRAFSILQELDRQKGPGFVLSDLVPDIFNQSLSVATYVFDASQNPRLASVPCKWAAVFINVNYQSYFEREFPEGRGYWLAPDMGLADGGDMLEILPLPSSRPEILDRWIKADQAAHGLAGLAFDNHDWRSRAPIVGRLKDMEGLFRGDRFLESCFFEKIAENEYQDRHYEDQLSALREAVEKGVPAAHLYNNLGALLLRRGQIAGAREAFQKALQCAPRHTSAAAGLALSMEMEKTGFKPADGN